MIVGVGTDIIEIGRISKAVSRNKRFILKNFTVKEQVYFEKQSYRAESIAGNFAAKEAVSKALGTGFKGFGLKDIEVLRNEQGGPVVFLYGKAKQISMNHNIDHIWVSISHCKAYATAVAVAEIRTK